MDQIPAQPPEVSVNHQTENIPSGEIAYPPTQSSFKKILLLAFLGAFILIVFAGTLFLLGGKSTKQTVVPTPTVRPTATPLPPPAMPEISEEPAPTTVSGTISPVKIGRLAFIKDGDIYHSDLNSFSLLIKNRVAAGDKLSWSKDGNFLSWRPKTDVATPSAVTVYNRKTNTTTSFPPAGQETEIIDYAFSPDEKQIAVLSHGNSYRISLYALGATASATLVDQSFPIQQIIWPEKGQIIFSDSRGIANFNIDSSKAQLTIENPSIREMKLSPDGKKLLYSAGTKEKSDFYLVDLDGGNNQMIPSVPEKIDMGQTNLSSDVLSKGFIPFAVFFPKGDKLLVGYHYLTNLPLVGIYDLSNNSFTAVNPFYLKSNDVMVDEYRLLGERVVTTAIKIPFWQVSLFTLEDNSRLGIIKAIPQAHSPAFFAQGL